MHMYIYICRYTYTREWLEINYIYHQKWMVSNPQTVRRRSYPRALLPVVWDDCPGCTRCAGELQFR